jgi:Fe-S cluster biosynthesis and repair protein YggX
MPHITLSLPKKVYEEIKKHPEIKWSEVARMSIILYLAKLKEKSESEEVLSMLSPKARSIIEKIPEKKAKKFYEKMVKEEWKRMKSTTRAC